LVHAFDAGENGVVGFALGSNQTRGALLQNGNLNEDTPFWWEGIADAGWWVVHRSYLHCGLVGVAGASIRPAGNAPCRSSWRATGARITRWTPCCSTGLYTDKRCDTRRRMLDIIKKWNDTYAYPKITPSTDADYHEYITRNFGKKLPVYRGDVERTGRMVGVHAYETAMNRASQILLPQAEAGPPALATAFHPSELYPTDEFHEAWNESSVLSTSTPGGAHNSISQPDRKFVTAQCGEVKRSFAWRANWGRYRPRHNGH
jgi:hypothetical protein